MLFSEAMDKFASVLVIKPDKHEAFHNWGTALLVQALTKQGNEADLLYSQAGEKFSAALAIMPQKSESHVSWGLALLAQGCTKAGDVAIALYSNAATHFLAAEAMDEGCAPYSLALVAAAQGNVAEAVDWLIKSHAFGRDWPGCSSLKTEKGFNSIRDDTAFQQALEQIGCLCSAPPPTLDPTPESN